MIHRANNEDGKAIGIQGIARDVPERERMQAMVSGLNRVLEMLVRGAPLWEVLDRLSRLVEEQAVGAICSIVLLDQGSEISGAGSAHGFQADCEAGLEGVPGVEVPSVGIRVDPEENTIGAAMTADTGDMEITREARVVWPTHIFSSNGELLGTFEVAFRDGRSASLCEMTFVEMTARVASIAIERSRAEQARRESEELFRSLTETVSASIFIYQGEGFTYFNSACERLTGYTRQELMAMGTFDLIHPDCREAVIQISLARRRGEAAPDRYETRIMTRNGEERWVELAATSIRFRGQPAVLSTAFDITGRKRAEETLRASEERYRMLFERNLAGVYRTSLDGRLIDINEAAARILGYESREAALSRSMWDFYFDPNERQVVIKLLTEQGSLTNYEGRAKKKDGTLIWILANVSMLRTGASTTFEGTIVDITDRKRIQEALEKSEW